MARKARHSGGSLLGYPASTNLASLSRAKRAIAMIHCRLLSWGSGGLFFVKEKVKPNQGYAELEKKARRTHEEILEKLCGNEVKILREFFQNHTKF